MFNIVIFGAPGSGKGTQSDLIESKYHLKHISTGELLRSEIERDSEEGRIANNLISKGNLVPDDLIIGLLKKKIESSPSRTGYIFDGFPRTVAQAEALDKMLSERGEKVNVLLDLEVNEKILIERLLNRGKTSGRSDDNLDTIKKRLQIYHEVTMPVMDYYKKTDRYREVCNNTTVAGCFEHVVEILDSIHR